MFCGKCGSYFEGDGTLCSQCAAEQAAQAGNETAAPADDTFQLNTAAPTGAGKPPKKKRGLIAGIVAAAVVVACGLGAFLCRDSIKGFTDRTFKSPEAYFVDVQKTAIAEHSDELTQTYGKLLNTYYDDEAAEMTGFETEIAVTLGDDVLSLMESALSQQGMDMDISWLKDIRLSLSANVQDTKMQMLLSAALGKNKLLSADVIMDTDNSKVYAAVPELNKDYLMVDASDMFSAEDIQAALVESTEMTNKMLKVLPSEEVLNNLIDTYVDIALSSIEDVEKETETVEVGEASQKMVVLTAKITEADLIKIAQNVLEEARDDKDLKQIMDNLGEFYADYYDFEIDMGEEFQAAVDSALEEMESLEAETDKSNYIELKTYVDMQSNLRGYELSVYEEGEPVMDTLSWLTAVNGKTTYTEADLDGVEIVGEKTENKSVSEGCYELIVEGSEMFTIEFEVEEEVRTTLRFVPGADLMDEIMSESGLPSALLGGNMALELSFGTDEADKSFCQLSVLAGSNTLFNVNLSAKAIDGGNITIPSDAIDALSDDAAQQWLANVDFEQLLTNLENAGIPADLVDTLRSYTSMLSYMS